MKPFRCAGSSQRETATMPSAGSIQVVLPPAPEKQTARSLADAVETLADASATLDLANDELLTDLEGDENGDVDNDAVADSKKAVASKEAELAKALLKVEQLEARLRNFKDDVGHLGSEIKNLVPVALLPKN